MACSKLSICTKIDVIMACYNSANTLDETIKSVLRQSDLNKFIIVNDGSTDNTDEIIKKYANHEKVLIKHNKNNKGLAFCLNLGMELSNADIISRIDADDLMCDGRIKAQLLYFNQNPSVDIVCSNATVQTRKRSYVTKLPETDRGIKKALSLYNPILHPTVSFKRNKIREIGGYNEEYRRAQDFDLWLRCAKENLVFANLTFPYTIINENTKRTFHSVLEEFKTIVKIALKMQDFKILTYSLVGLSRNLFRKLINSFPR